MHAHRHIGRLAAAAAATASIVTFIAPHSASAKEEPRRVLVTLADGKQVRGVLAGYDKKSVRVEVKPGQVLVLPRSLVRSVRVIKGTEPKASPQPASKAPAKEPPRQERPKTVAPEETVEEPEEKEPVLREPVAPPPEIDAQETPRGKGLPGVLRVPLELFGGALGGAVGMGGSGVVAVRVFQTQTMDVAERNDLIRLGVTAGVGALVLGPPATALGVWGTGKALGTDAAYLPALGGAMIGVLVGSGVAIGTFDLDRIERLLVVPTLMVGGSVVGYEIGRAARKARAMRDANTEAAASAARMRVMVLPTRGGVRTGVGFTF